MDEACTSVEQLSDEDFSSFKDSVCKSVLKKIYTVEKLGKVFWRSICDRTFDFQKRQHIAENIRSLTKNDLKLFMDCYIRKSSERRTLLVEYGKGETNQFTPIPPNGKLFSVSEFRALTRFVPTQGKDYNDLHCTSIDC